MGPAMEPHVRGLLDIMFSAGLSPTLVEALEQIAARYAWLSGLSFVTNIIQGDFSLTIVVILVFRRSCLPSKIGCSIAFLWFFQSPIILRGGQLWVLAEEIWRIFLSKSPTLVVQALCNLLCKLWLVSISRFEYAYYLLMMLFAP